jgi:hypothetical protein
MFVGVAIAIAAVPVSCAVLGGAVAEKVAHAVEKYCEEPLSYRELYGNTVNGQLVGTGHVVHVHCSGDPATTP